MLCLIFPTSILTTVSVICVSTYLFKCNKNLGKIFDENPGFLTERQKRGKVGKNAWGDELFKQQCYVFKRSELGTVV